MVARIMGLKTVDVTRKAPRGKPLGKKASQDLRLKRFALRVRLMPTISLEDARAGEAHSFNEDHLAGFIHGYNKVILAMRRIFEEEGFTT